MRLRLFFLVYLLATASSADLRPVVRIQSGEIRGIASINGSAFLGIPFARPPTGNLRWRPPVPELPWPGTRAADKMPVACAQRSMLGDFVGSEDCLYLNVWVPPDIHPNEKLPVFFFIHGGGLILGSSSDTILHGANLAASGRFIVVTTQYRLGMLGYLAHPALRAESGYGGSGNYGMMDQIAALKWVQNNISSFGGDPKLVTLAGESAGGSSVCALVTSPRTGGLFARAVMESAPCLALSKEVGEAEGVGYALKAGCHTLSCLRSRLPEAVVPISPVELVARTDFRRTTVMLTVDDYLLPATPRELVRQGKSQPVPLLLGSNSSEGKFFVPFLFNAGKISSQVDKFYGPERAAELYAQYPEAAFDSATEQAQAVLSDGLFECGVRNFARHHRGPVFRYLYSHEVSVLGVAVPAFHAMELPFVFQNVKQRFGLLVTAEDLAVQKHFLNYWGQFIRTGNPNGTESPHWANHRPTDENILNISFRPTEISGRHRAACELWDADFPY